MSRRLIAFSLALLTLLALPATARAQSAPTLTLLLIESDDADLSDEAARVTNVLKELLDQSDIVQLTDEPAFSMGELLLLNGCEIDTSDCLRTVSVDFQTQQILYGRIESMSASQLMVRLRVYDRNRHELKPIYTRAVDTANIAEVLRADLGDLLTGTLWELPAYLSISFNRAPPRDLLILLDGIDLGPAPIIRHKVDPGSHNIRVQASGFQTWTQSLDFSGGKLVELSVPLQREGSTANGSGDNGGDGNDTGIGAGDGTGDGTGEPVFDGEGVYQAPTLGWVLLGVGGGFLAGAVVTGLLKLEADQDFVDEVRQRQATELKERSENLALATNILATTGGIALITAGVAFLVMGDYVAPPTSARDTASSLTPSSISASPLRGGAFLELGWSF